MVVFSEQGSSRPKGVSKEIFKIITEYVEDYFYLYIFYR